MKIRKIWGKTVIIIIAARPSSQRGWVWNRHDHHHGGPTAPRLVPNFCTVTLGVVKYDVKSPEQLTPPKFFLSQKSSSSEVASFEKAIQMPCRLVCWSGQPSISSLASITVLLTRFYLVLAVGSLLVESSKTAPNNWHRLKSRFPISRMDVPFPPHRMVRLLDLESAGKCSRSDGLEMRNPKVTLKSQIGHLEPVLWHVENRPKFLGFLKNRPKCLGSLRIQNLMLG